MVEEEMEKKVEEVVEEENIMDDLKEKFIPIFKKCEKCVSKENAKQLCRRHNTMVAKYVREEYEGSMKELAKLMNKGFF